jgi:broad specificity phosphatase PhoE
MNRQLILVRHSLPEIREDRPAREWHLSEEGRRRAERLADRLIQYHPEIVVTSPEPKARETAVFLSRRLQLSMLENADLHEHERTSLPYLTRSKFESAVREFFADPDRLVFGSETANQAYDRFSRAVAFAFSQADNSKIVIVAHGTVISLFVSRLTGQPGFKIWSGLGLPCFIILDMQSKDLVALENFS